MWLLLPSGVRALAGDPAMAKTVEKGKKQFVGNEIKGKTLGVIGLGAIGLPRGQLRH